MANATKNTTKYDQHATKAKEASAAALAAVSELLTAREELAEVRAAATAGDLTVTPEALATATAAVELAELRAVGADSRAAVAHAGAPFRPILAETVARALEAVGYPASAVETVPASDKVPALYVMQHQAASLAMGGGYTGRVELTYKRGPLHRELDSGEMTRSLRDQGVNVTNASGKGDRITLTVSLRPTVPFLAALSDDAGRDVANDLAGHFVGGYGRSGKVESESVKDGKRTAVLSVVIETNDAPGDVNHLLRQATSAGRVVAVERVSGGHQYQSDTTPAGNVILGPEVYRLTLRVTLESTTEPYANVLATAPYVSLFTTDRYTAPATVRALRQEVSGLSAAAAEEIAAARW